MKIEFKQDRHSLVARLTGELDHHSAINVRLTIDRRFNNPEIRNLVLNLKQVTFMDSSGVGVILGRYRLVEGRGGKMALCLIPAGVLKVLQISGVTKVIPFLDSEQQALEAVSHR
ncbi:MAG TPA: anti-sigma F factor antagonist [Firmicutes bacterium]|nr:anti-sigma F factor antagonist [Bacillota bacterium]